MFAQNIGNDKFVFPLDMFEVNDRYKKIGFHESLQYISLPKDANDSGKGGI
jgi:hypothetical protein